MKTWALCHSRYFARFLEGLGIAALLFMPNASSGSQDIPFDFGLDLRDAGEVAGDFLGQDFLYLELGNADGLLGGFERPLDHRVVGGMCAIIASLSSFSRYLGVRATKSKQYGSFVTS